MKIEDATLQGFEPGELVILTLTRPSDARKSVRLLVQLIQLHPFFIVGVELDTVMYTVFHDKCQWVQLAGKPNMHPSPVRRAWPIHLVKELTEMQRRPGVNYEQHYQIGEYAPEKE